ncbi:hypothetical protein [Microbulbifer sp. THAF38]|uniref:hypothetical protein n=1 Tax=Microbulbifer sp. THAF38 TaxID=2587856 RepID=UPI0012692EE3|nr:hypothetical protein [Microbulbifer sp. THAF38]QFT57143.1 hypothetical protein FIU95_21560 [Microbulbifer sp. THAF38]
MLKLSVSDSAKKHINITITQLSYIFFIVLILQICTEGDIFDFKYLFNIDTPAPDKLPIIFALIFILVSCLIKVIYHLFCLIKGKTSIPEAIKEHAENINANFYYIFAVLVGCQKLTEGNIFDYQYLFNPDRLTIGFVLAAIIPVFILIRSPIKIAQQTCLLLMMSFSHYRKHPIES